MKKTTFCALLLLCVLPAVVQAADSAPLASIKAVTGEVLIGQGDSWTPAVVGTQLVEGQVVKTGASSQAEILFEGSISAVVPQDTAIEVADLLLKTRLENMKGKVSSPEGNRKVELQVTPTTGVRGTEQTERKAEDLKRDHFWNEKVK